MKFKTFYLLSLLISCFTFQAFAQDKYNYQFVENVPYYDAGQDDYQRTQCLLDIYYPVDGKEKAEGRPVVVWFHGGGLTGGQKEIPSYLKDKGLVVVGVGYRFSPKVKVEGIIHDAAKAVSFIYNQVNKYNGDKNKFFLSGHSAGGYLVTMLALNPSYLEPHGMNANDLTGVISFSGQAITHFTARKELGIDEKQPTIDALAPLYWVRKDAPPLVLLTGDREKEMLGRYEENAYLKRMMDIVGHPDTKLMEFQGYGHGMTYPGFPVMLEEMQRILTEKNN
ncbi:Acetyl esterase/lipase [Sphingobacterium wenxiniae]|uniref:Acetyl esterase/lipase n=2 Tax=Sphingobacterium wenxiniae TaxID=683125 RepID=A0A1I6P7Q2_9SPHI|nr:Acetyl esterase/lipase [Sphingobacterium wenxiniae]